MDTLVKNAQGLVQTGNGTSVNPNFISSTGLQQAQQFSQNTNTTPPTQTPGQIADAQELARQNGTITTDSLAPAKPLSLPDISNPSHAEGLLGIADSVKQSTQAQIKNQQDLEAKQAEAQNNLDSSKKSWLDTVKQITGIQSSRLNEEANAGIPDKLQKITDYTNQLEASQRAQQNEIRALDGSGLTDVQKAQKTREINRQYAFEQADLALLQSAANRDYTTAQNIVDRKINLQLEPLQTQLEYNKSVYEDNKDLLSKEEQRAFENKINLQNQQYDLAKEQYTNLENNKFQILKNASELGAPQDVLSRIQNAQSIGDAIQQAGDYLRASKYTPLPYGSNTLYDSRTGETKTIGANYLSTGSSVINGYNLGATSTLGAYATDPQQPQKVANIANTLTNSIGLISNSTQAQQAINLYAPNSPITGEMIMNSANKYGVDPTTLLALMTNDSRLGTAGVGAKTFNPGNVGNTDNGSTKTFSSWQAGIDAAAQNLAQRKTDDAQLILDATKKYNVALTGDEVQRFNSIPENMKSSVAGLLNGSRLVSDFSTKNGLRQQIVDYAQKVDPTFNEASLAAGQSFQKSADTQKFIANANTAANTVDKVVELSDKVDRSNIKLLSNGMLALKSGTGDVNTQNFITATNLLADEVGKILGSGQGSDFAIQLGQSIISPTFSKDQIKGSANLLKDRIANKIGEYKGQFTQGTNNNVTSGSGKDPLGLGI